MYYLNSRYYYPTIGRFISADGYVSTGQDILGTNMFAYCLNNPVNMLDKSGSCARFVEMIINSIRSIFRKIKTAFIFKKSKRDWNPSNDMQEEIDIIASKYWRLK